MRGHQPRAPAQCAHTAPHRRCGTAFYQGNLKHRGVDGGDVQSDYEGIDEPDEADEADEAEADEAEAEGEGVDGGAGDDNDTVDEVEEAE